MGNRTSVSVYDFSLSCWSLPHQFAEWLLVETAMKQQKWWHERDFSYVSDNSSVAPHNQCLTSHVLLMLTSNKFEVSHLPSIFIGFDEPLHINRLFPSCDGLSHSGIKNNRFNTFHKSGHLYALNERENQASVKKSRFFFAWSCSFHLNDRRGPAGDFLAPSGHSSIVWKFGGCRDTLFHW